MTEKLPRKLVTTLNKFRWVHTTNRCPTEEWPETDLWAGGTSYENMRMIIDEIRASGTGIKTHPTLNGDVFCVAFPVSQLRALADNGVRFARAALKNPDAIYIDPAHGRTPIWR